jgi:hypothetical protein
MASLLGVGDSDAGRHHRWCCGRTWFLAGTTAAIVLAVSLSALSILDKSLEYVLYKRQLPLLGAAGLWLVIGAALLLAACVNIFTLSIWYMFWCMVHLVGLACTKCFFGSHEWWSEKLGAAREGLREAWKLPGEAQGQAQVSLSSGAGSPSGLSSASA